MGHGQACSGSLPGHPCQHRLGAIYCRVDIAPLRLVQALSSGVGAQTVEERFRAMSAAIQASGRPMVFALCEWGLSQPWLYAAEVLPFAASSDTCMCAHAPSTSTDNPQTICKCHMPGMDLMPGCDSAHA